MKRVLSRILLGTSIAAIGAAAQTASAQSLGEVVQNAITGQSVSPDDSNSGRFCSSTSTATLITGTSDDAAANIVATSFGPNLQRVCQVFNNSFGGSGLGSGGLYALTASRTVSQKKAQAVRQEKSSPRQRRDGRQTPRRQSMRSYQVAYNGDLASLGVGTTNDAGTMSAWAQADYGKLDRETTRYANGYEAETAGVWAGMDFDFPEAEATLSVAIGFNTTDGDIDPESERITLDSYPVITSPQASDPFPATLNIRDYDEFFTAVGSPNTVCGAQGHSGFKRDVVQGEVSAAKRLGGVILSAGGTYADASTDYSRLVCGIQMDYTGNGGAGRLLLNGGRVGADPGEQRLSAAFGAAMPMQAGPLVLTPSRGVA
jgi:hypothetical protein